MKADICIPALNEAAIIKEALTTLDAILARIVPHTYTLVVANNGSTDETGRRALEVPGVRVIDISERGKGNALRVAATESTADYFGFTDADLAADPEDFKLLFDALAQGADIAIGSRLLKTQLVHRSYLRTLSSRVFNLLRQMLLGISVVDTQCGMKLMNAHGRELLRTCEEKGWFLDMEFLARAERGGLKIVEIPIHWEEKRFTGRVSKLRLVTDAIGAVRAMIRIRRRLS